MDRNHSLAVHEVFADGEGKQERKLKKSLARALRESSLQNLAIQLSRLVRPLRFLLFALQTFDS
jgi:hypothetical protein